MQMLDAEDYEELMKHEEQSRKTCEDVPTLKAKEGQTIVYVQAYVSRDQLRDVADESNLSDEAWDMFKYAEEYGIELLVDEKTGRIVNARLNSY